MRYEVELKRVKTKTVEVFAGSPQEAVKLAAKDGFKAEYVTERISEDNDGESYEVTGCCEACSNPLLDDDHKSDADGVQFCEQCFDELVAAEA